MPQLQTSSFDIHLAFVHIPPALTREPSRTKYSHTCAEKPCTLASEARALPADGPKALIAVPPPERLPDERCGVRECTAPSSWLISSIRFRAEPFQPTDILNILK